MKDDLRAMLNTIIDDNEEEAKQHLHSYIVAKTRELTSNTPTAHYEVDNTDNENN
jgi:F0F1-type ATP synthase membrane subunit b/b'